MYLLMARAGGVVKLCGEVCFDQEGRLPIPHKVGHGSWQGANAATHSSAVVAFLLEASIVPQRVLYSARVMSDVQHLAEASDESVAGVKGWFKFLF